MFRRLRIRLTVVCTLVTGLVLLGMAAASLWYSETQFRRQAEETFSANINSIFFYLRGQQSVDQSWLSQTEWNNGMLIRVEDSGHPLLYTYNSPRRELLTGKAQQAALDEFGFDWSAPPTSSVQADLLQFRIKEEGVWWRAAVCRIPMGGNWLSVTVLKEQSEELRQILLLRLTFGGFVIVAALCLLLFAWLFTARAIRPVEESRKRQNEFISAASHELRSPLAVMRASAGAMETASLEQARRFGRTIDGECARLTSLTNDLLALAGADSQRWSLEFSLVEPETLLLSVAERYEPLAAEKELSLRPLLPDEPLPRLRCDKQRIEQLLDNLVDNAVSYTPSGGSISISAAQMGKKISFVVQDNGPGVPDEQKQLIFGRFYRGDSSRRRREHYGLGLSIAWEIAQLHRGSLSVTDAPGGGALFTLTLPSGS